MIQILVDWVGLDGVLIGNFVYLLYGTNFDIS